MVGVVPANLTAAAGGHAKAGHLLNLFNGPTGAALFALPATPDIAGVESAPGGATLPRFARHKTSAAVPSALSISVRVFTEGGCRTHIMNRVLRI